MASVVNYRLFGNVVNLPEELLSDANFDQLAASQTTSEQFLGLVNEHLPGYTQKRRLLDGLKELLTKVEAAENKLYMVKNVGKKAGALESEDEKLINRYGTLDIKEKRKSLLADLNSMIEAGRLTVEEKPVLQEQLAAKRAAAKEDNKPSLVEKTELQLVSLGRAEGITHPVPNLEDFFSLEQELQHIQILEKKAGKKLTNEEQETVKNKGNIQESIRELAKKHRMWFETDHEIHRRLEKAFIELARLKAEQKKREAEEAEERKRRAEEEAMEQKRQALKEAEDKKAQELEAKLQAKRAEAALKPAKEIPQPKKKEKVKVTKIDTKTLGFRTEVDEQQSNQANAEAAEYQELIRDLYRRHDPANAGKVDALLEKFKGMEIELYKMACSKFGDYGGSAGEDAPSEQVVQAKVEAANAQAAAPEEEEEEEPQSAEQGEEPPEQATEQPAKKAPAKPATRAPWLNASSAKVTNQDLTGEEAAGPSLSEAATKKADKPTLLRSQPKKGTKGTRLDASALGFRTEIDEQKAGPVAHASTSAPSKEASGSAVLADREAAVAEAEPAAAAEPEATEVVEPEVAAANDKQEAAANETQQTAQDEEEPAALAADVEQTFPTLKKGGPAPKKREKKKFTKMAVGDLGFDANNPNFV
eukprot:TRINITY_DN43630_c0_g1_i1.p1 TRINITY_DN43630_c0_g1~~TRINITY_DN43630_c0_g1_i1.p1  ORF type:complete len:646 (+),score=233.05 TRINITY_DN43630_c0_g1_i1:97-2034(+)